MQSAGKILVVTILAVAILVGLLNVALQIRSSRQALVIWKPQYVQLIRNAPQVEAWKLRESRSNKDPEKDVVDGPNGARYAVVNRRRIEQIADVVHIRRALLNERYLLEAPAKGDCEPQWEYVVEFRDGERTATIWIDSACDVLHLQETGDVASMQPGVLRSIREKMLAVLLKQ